MVSEIGLKETPGALEGRGASSARTWRASLRVYAVALVAYLLATWATEPHFMADTVPYADAALSGDRVRIWEFGHLLWRPLGRAFGLALEPVTRHFTGGDERAGIVLVFVTTSWLAGLLGVICLAGLARRFCRREWAVMVAVVGFIFAHGFLNFTQAGAPYVPGLAFLTAGLYLLTRHDATERRAWPTAFAAGLMLALSVGMWFLYIWSLPAALLSPLFLSGWTKKNLKLVVLSTIACALCGALIFGAAAGLLGIHTVEGFRAWVVKASHGATSSGLTRMLFGFARSFVNMGNDGMLVKRFMLHDPYNPVTLSEIFRLSLWKLALFYLFLASVVINLARWKGGRRVLALLLVNALPMLGFAILWQGGDIERYLPLYPLVFLALAVSLDGERAIPLLKYAALLFVLVASVVSVMVMAKPVLRGQERAVMSRLEDLRPRLKPESLVVTTHQQDELWRANYSFPFNPFFKEHANLVYAAANLGTVHTLEWREDFAARAVKTWDAGGDVWLSRRFFAQRPRAEWNWVEGASPVTWTHLHDFFSQMETGETAGGEDGFILLLRSQRNEELLRQLAARSETTKDETSASE